GAHPDLHSFPTRRSSDLRNASTDSSVETGESHATNDLSAFVGLDTAGDTSIGGADVSGVTGENVQDGNNTATRTQAATASSGDRSEEHTSELQSLAYLVC